MLVEGVRIIKKHLRKSQDNPTGKIASAKARFIFLMCDCSSARNQRRVGNQKRQKRETTRAAKGRANRDSLVV